MRDIKHDVERCVALFLLIERQFGDGDKNVQSVMGWEINMGYVFSPEHSTKKFGEKFQRKLD